MKKNILLLLGIVVLLGIGFAGCSNGSGGGGGGSGSDFAGRWMCNDGGNITYLEAANGKLTFSVVLPPETVVEEGTYKVNGNTVTVTVVRVNTAMFGTEDQHGGTWFTYSDLPAVYKGYMDTDTYVCTVANNTFTLVVSGGPMIFVKQ